MSRKAGLLVVDPWHWLDPDGYPPREPARLRRQTLRVARLIEYAGLLKPGFTRETLIECFRPGGEPKCSGMLWVTKDENDSIWAWCDECLRNVMVISNWQGTRWANGPMVPMPM